MSNRDKAAKKYAKYLGCKTLPGSAYEHFTNGYDQAMRDVMPLLEKAYIFVDMGNVGQIKGAKEWLSDFAKLKGDGG